MSFESNVERIIPVERAQLERAFIASAEKLTTLYSAPGSPWIKRPDLSTADVVARYGRGESAHAIAQILGCSERTVIMRLDQAGVSRRKWSARGRTSYGSFHRHVRVIRGTPAHCEHCGNTDRSIRYEWANLTGQYADPNDYIRLCKRCHMRFDNVPAKITADKTGRPRRDMQGERHRSAKLTPDLVRSIRQRALTEPLIRIATEFGLSDVHVGRIVHRKAWRHLP